MPCSPSSVFAGLWGHAWALILDTTLPRTHSIPFLLKPILTAGLFSKNICSHLLLVLLIREGGKKKQPLKKSSIFSTSFPLIWFDILPPPLWKALLWNSYWLSDRQLWWPLSPQAQYTPTQLEELFSWLQDQCCILILLFAFIFLCSVS